MGSKRLKTVCTFQNIGHCFNSKQLLMQMIHGASCDVFPCLQVVRAKPGLLAHYPAAVLILSKTRGWRTSLMNTAALLLSQGGVSSAQVSIPREALIFSPRFTFGFIHCYPSLSLCTPSCYWHKSQTFKPPQPQRNCLETTTLPLTWLFQLQFLESGIVYLETYLPVRKLLLSDNEQMLKWNEVWIKLIQFLQSFRLRWSAWYHCPLRNFVYSWSPLSFAYRWNRW